MRHLFRGKGTKRESSARERGWRPSGDALDAPVVLAWPFHKFSFV